MFDFLRNLRKSDEDKIQEALTAYLDGALAPSEKRNFEQRLAADEALRADLEQQRLVKANLSALPRLRAPRNFTLDPALYGRPQPAGRLYPALRTATVLATILFVVVLSLDLIGTARPLGLAGAPSEAELSQLVSEPEADLGFADEAAARVEVTRVVEAETVIEEAEEVVVEEAAPIEEAPEEAPALEEAELAPLAPAEAESGGESVSATPPLAASEGETAPQDGTADVPAAELEPLTTVTAAPLPTPTAAPSPDAATLLAEALDEVGAADDDVATAEARALPPELQAAADEVAGQERGGGLLDLPILRVLAIALGIGVVLLATATLLLRRRL
jgi:anti-sigma factor RsiW